MKYSKISFKILNTFLFIEMSFVSVSDLIRLYTFIKIQFNVITERNKGLFEK